MLSFCWGDGVVEGGGGREGGEGGGGGREGGEGGGGRGGGERGGGGEGGGGRGGESRGVVSVMLPVMVMSGVGAGDTCTLEDNPFATACTGAVTFAALWLVVALLADEPSTNTCDTPVLESTCFSSGSRKLDFDELSRGGLGGAVYGSVRRFIISPVPRVTSEPVSEPKKGGGAV